MKDKFVFPCKDCILLPLCNAQYSEHPHHIYRSAFRLAKKCSILTKHLDDHYYDGGTSYDFLRPIIDFYSNRGSSD